MQRHFMFDIDTFFLFLQLPNIYSFIQDFSSCGNEVDRAHCIGLFIGVEQFVNISEVNRQVSYLLLLEIRTDNGDDDHNLILAHAGDAERSQKFQSKKAVNSNYV